MIYYILTQIFKFSLCWLVLLVRAYSSFLYISFQLNVTSAAMKSLGELDILLDWMEKSR